jgi:hypothetical protein
MIKNFSSLGSRPSLRNDVILKFGAEPSSSQRWFISFSNGAFTRSTETAFQTGQSSVQIAAPNAIVYENLGDGAGNLLSIQGAFVNFLRQGRALQLSPWATIGSSSVVTGTIAGPDGRMACAITSSTGTNRRQNISAIPTSAPQCLSSWVRSASGTLSSVATFTVYTGGATSNLRSLGLSASQSWQRVSVVEDSYGAAGSSVYLAESTDRSTLGGITAGIRYASYDLLQLELSFYPRRTIRTQTSTVESSSADVLLFPSSAVDLKLFSEPAGFSQMSPYWATSEIVSGSIYWLLSIGGSSNGVRIRHDGTNIRAEIVSSSLVVAQSPNMTGNRNNLYGSVSWVPRSGTISINNISGAVGTAFTWPVSDIRIGGILNGTGEFDGRLGALGEIGNSNGLGSTRRSIDVMWVGDSIVAGGTSTFAQWRKYIQDLTDAQNENKWYNTVGPLIGSAGVAFNQDKSLCQNGATVETVQGWITTYSLPAGYSPDIIAIHVGTNNLALSGDTPAQLATKLGSLLDDFHAAFPSALKILMKILPRQDSFSDEVATFNDTYHAGVVSDAVARGINVQGDDTLANTSVVYLDSVHPSSSSGPTIGTNMYGRVRVWASI